MAWTVVPPAVLAFLLYWNTLWADFAYDDSRAILKNQDLQEDTPWVNIFYDDFWGTPLRHSGSHKSYRPICVLTFRLNYMLGKLEPFGYHLGNVILHVITTTFFSHTVWTLTKRTFTATVAGLLFASHPVHTEAVAGIVGRADVLACALFLGAFLCYQSYCKYRDKNSPRKHIWLLVAAILTGVSMLSKEQGVTVLAVCAVYDIFYAHKVVLKNLPRIHKVYPDLVKGLFSLGVIGLLLIFLRIQGMGLRPPEFAPADNPASVADSVLTRFLTFIYLPYFNFHLLLYPRVLSFDWSMDAVPMVESIFDLRNIYTICFYSALGFMGFYVIQSMRKSHPEEKCIKNGFSNHVTNVSHSSSNHVSNHVVKRNSTHRRGSSSSTDSEDKSPARTKSYDHQSIKVIAISLAFLIFPFIPASNLFFYVGFVIAERVLYIPSMGFCLLVAEGASVVYHMLWREKVKRKALVGLLVVLLLVYSVRTVLRNEDWQTEEKLYQAGIKVNPAKAWGNLANILNQQGRVKEAEQAYRSALSHRGNMADVHYNLGILLQDQKRHNEAIESYEMAIRCRPRLTMAHLNLAIVKALIGQKREAEKIYYHCADLDTSGLKDPRAHATAKISCLYNLGRLLADQDRMEEALTVYMEAIKRRPSYYTPQSLYNMIGEAYAKMNQLDKAEHWYLQALQSKPDHVPAHLTMARLEHKKNNIEGAESWYRKALSIDSKDESVYQHYGQFLSDTHQYLRAAQMYKEALVIIPKDFELISNTANVLRQAGRYEEAEKYYRLAVQVGPDVPSAHMNLGAMLHFNSRLSEAEQSYQMALKLKPDDEVTLENLRKLRNLMQKNTRR